MRDDILRCILSRRDTIPGMDGSAEKELIGVGVYTLPQASRLAHVPTTSLRRWLYGYSYDSGGQQRAQPAVAEPDETLRELRVVTFADLIEIQYIHAFRGEGVSWPVLRKAAAAARRITGSPHPFATRQFVSDGRTVFAEIANSLGHHELLDLRNNQMAFRRVLLPSLREKLELGDKGVIRLWPMGKRKPVLIDPELQFGQPISAEEGVPTAVLARAYKAMGSYSAVVKWFQVSKGAARAAVEFETRLAA